MFAEVPVYYIKRIRRSDAVGEPHSCGLADSEWRAQSMPAVKTSNPGNQIVEFDPIGRCSPRTGAVLAEIVVVVQRLAERIAAVPEEIPQRFAEIADDGSGLRCDLVLVHTTPPRCAKACPGGRMADRATLPRGPQPSRSCHYRGNAPTSRYLHTGCRMDSWNAQRELAQSQIAEIEDKIARQRQMAARLQNDDTSLPIPLISVMQESSARVISVLQESLARAKAHAQYVEQRIAAHQADSGRRTARAALVHVARIELTIAEYDRNAKALENAIRAEEDRNGNHDWAHVAYPDAAKWKIERRDNLMRSIDAMKGQLARAQAALDRTGPAPADGDSRLPSAMP